MKKKMFITMIAMLVIVSVFTACEDKKEKEFTIGISQIASHPALDGAREGFLEGLKSQGMLEGINIISENAHGDLATAQLIAQKFVDEEVDLIFAIATPSAQAAFNTTKDIPIIISAVTDPFGAGLVKSNEVPSFNVSGTSDKAPIGLQLDLLDALDLKGDTIGFIYNTSEKNSEVQLETLKTEAKNRDIEVIAVGVNSTVEIEQSLRSILKRVDILYTPADNIVATSIELITRVAIEEGIPVLAAEPELVKSGALITSGVNYFNLGQQSGVMAANVLKGKDISKMSIQFAENPEIFINADTALKLGINIPKALREKSNIVGE